MPPANRPVILRTSCDQCQMDKVRCSRDKPSCKRCGRRQICCIYSPVKTLGRPRKGVAAAHRPRTGDDTPELETDSFTPSGYVTQSTGSFSHAASTTATSLDGGSPANPCFRGESSPLHMIDDGNTASVLRESDTANIDPRESSTFRDILHSQLDLEDRLSSCATAVPPIDATLKAEGVFFSLHRRLLESHGQYIDSLTVAAVSSTHTTPGSEQHTRGPATPRAPDATKSLSLAMLGDRVVGMLESLVRLAAQSAITADRAGDVFWSATGTTSQTAPTLSARRMQRSFRTSWSKSCTSLDLEADRNLRLGNFMLPDMARSAALRRVLKLRSQRFQGALEALKEASSRPRLNSNDGMSRGPSSDLVSWDGSSAVMGSAAITLLDDLLRRMRLVQGVMSYF